MSSGTERPDLASAVEHALGHVAHLLPDQGPIEVFVHHNTLHAFEHQSFFDAVRDAERLLGVTPIWPLQRYHELRRQGRIDDAAIAAGKEAFFARGGKLPSLEPALKVDANALLDAVLAEPLTPYGSPEEVQFAIDELGALDGAAGRALFAECLRVPLRKALRPRGSRRTLVPRWPLIRAGATDSTDWVNPVMVRLTAAYLDLGLARRFWPERSRGFFAGFCELLTTSRGPVPAWQHDALRDVEEDVRLGRSAADVVRLGLSELGAGPDDAEDVVRELLLQLPGWAGMMSRLERVPADRPAGSPPASLLEFLAVRLRFDLSAWRHLAAQIGHTGGLADLAAHVERRKTTQVVFARAHEGAYPLYRIASRCGLTPDALAELDAEARERLLAAAFQLAAEAAPRILHEAYERHYADRFMASLVAPGRSPRVVRAPTLGVVTCIDDREESFRRAIEETDPDALTFGTAGFFGLPIAFRGLDELGHAALCPVVQTPATDLVERPADEHADRGEARAFRRGLVGRLEAMLLRGTRSLGWGVVLTPVVGLVSALPFAAQVLFPRATSQARKTATRSLFPAPRTRLDHGEGGRQLALPERAGRVQATLEGMGLVRDFPKVVVVLGHGSSSVNNPHRSAYDCGACGGRHGGPNARYFAALANDPDVRSELRARGIDVPGSTWFVGGAHDTSTDGVELYDLGEVPEASRAAVEASRRTLEVARRRSAHERCRRFDSAPRRLTLEGALRHVEARAEDLGQARPELGHVTNAACIVGRRSLSEGLFLDRRSFLVSYDPEVDEAGRILERTLAAVGPVGAGISLEYFFSTCDNARLGCGTKLPHNVVGLVGVMEGSESDLRTGLPRQMIEIHEPMRLLLVCETNVDVMRDILARNSGIRALVAHEWVRLLTIDPSSRAIFESVAGELVPYTPRELAIPVHASSMECYVRAGRAVDGFLPFFRIGAPTARRSSEAVHA